MEMFTFIGNFSNTEQSMVMQARKSLDYMSNKKVEFKEGETLTLKPLDYKILVE